MGINICLFSQHEKQSFTEALRTFNVGKEELPLKSYNYSPDPLYRFLASLQYQSEVRG